MKLPVVKDSSPLRLAAEQVFVPRWSAGADVFLSLESVFPLLPVLAKRKIVVVHDIHVIRHRMDPGKYPEDYSWRYRMWASWANRKAAEAADGVIAVSRFTGEEIHGILHVPLDRITVIPNGVDGGRFRRVRDGSILDEVRSRYNLPNSFYLYVGPHSKKKNLSLIVEAYAIAKPTRDVILPVVVAGDTRRAALYSSTLQRIDQTGLADFFRFLGNVPDEDLVALYSMARALIYPSLYEGFGLPPLEAMACGTPVVASNRTSVPEVVGDAALLIDPTDPASLIEALNSLNNPAVRSDLVARGLKRAQEFSWERTAELLIRALRAECV
jgi:glycosyltransferase involved in cell wall biosynthesis